LSTVPYFVGIAEFLTNVIPLICRSFRLMMKWFSVEYTVAKSVDVEMIIKLRAGYKYNTIISIRSGRVSNNCSKFFPCCGKGDQSFIHWIFECSPFSLCRYKSLDFIDDLFILFADKVRCFSLFPSYSNILEYENFI